jgi:hypothetical protein
VPYRKFVPLACLDWRIGKAEALYPGETVGDRLGLAEWLRGVVKVDEAGDVRLERRPALVNAMSDLFFGDERKEPLDLIQPFG